MGRTCCLGSGSTDHLGSCSSSSADGLCLQGWGQGRHRLQGGGPGGQVGTRAYFQVEDFSYSDFFHSVKVADVSLLLACLCVSQPGCRPLLQGWGSLTPTGSSTSITQHLPVSHG